MTGFYILKPDMINDPNAIKYYLNYIENAKHLTLDNFYQIKDWITLSKLLYEPYDNNLSLEELKRLRKQYLTTIKGYEILYKDTPAILSMININDINTLPELFSFKKELRKKFVNNTNKYYIQFLNDINTEKKLIDIDLDKIKTNIISVSSNESISDPNYNMIFFNKIHFPDATIESISHDRSCIDELNIINSKNLIKRFL